VGTVNEYIDKFEELMGLVKRDNPFLKDEYFTCSFVSGLKEPIQHHLQCYKPTCLPDAFWYAKRLEQANPPQKKFNVYSPATKIQRPWGKDTTTHNQKDPVNIVELRAAGKCVKCREPWVPGHTKVCKAKQAYSVIVMSTPDGKEELGVVEDVAAEDEAAFYDAEQVPVMQISTHALLGTAHPTNTFTLQVCIGQHLATTLIDTGSDATFISAKFAVKTKMAISDITPVKVVAANGKTMLSNTACTHCSYDIQGHSFTSDFRLLELQGYDIILGADWIFTHSPVGLNLKTKKFSITKDGQEVVTFSDTAQVPKHLLISSKKMCKLLESKIVSMVLVLNCADNNKLSPTHSPDHPEIAALLAEFADIFRNPSNCH
jgi:hypothetical protein